MPFDNPPTVGLAISNFYGLLVAELATTADGYKIAIQMATGCV
jgi:hypothetical protein